MKDKQSSIITPPALLESVKNLKDDLFVMLTAYARSLTAETSDIRALSPLADKVAAHLLTVLNHSKGDVLYTQMYGNALQFFEASELMAFRPSLTEKCFTTTKKENIWDNMKRNIQDELLEILTIAHERVGVIVNHFNTAENKSLKIMANRLEMMHIFAVAAHQERLTKISPPVDQVTQFAGTLIFHHHLSWLENLGFQWFFEDPKIVLFRNEVLDTTEEGERLTVSEQMERLRACYLAIINLLNQNLGQYSQAIIVEAPQTLLSLLCELSRLAQYYGAPLGEQATEPVVSMHDKVMTHILSMVCGILGNKEAQKEFHETARHVLIGFSYLLSSLQQAPPEMKIHVATGMQIFTAFTREISRLLPENNPSLSLVGAQHRLMPCAHQAPEESMARSSADDSPTV